MALRRVRDSSAPPAFLFWPPLPKSPSRNRFGGCSQTRVGSVFRYTRMTQDEGTGRRLLKPSVADYLRGREGLFAVDKPGGITSFNVVSSVRKVVANHLRREGVQVNKLLAIKCGHGGTLDPLATGVLIVGIGKACKNTGAFLKGSKRYVATGLLGAETDTQDSEGVITVEVSSEHISADDIRQVLPDFIGTINQTDTAFIWKTPPVYSALKVGGKPAHQLARSGKAVVLQSRQIQVHSIELTGFNGKEFQLDIHCGSGTYVRTLIQDIAQALNGAAHMVKLRRTQQGPFTTGHALSLEAASNAETIFDTISRYRADVDDYLGEFSTDSDGAKRNQLS